MAIAEGNPHASREPKTSVTQRRSKGRPRTNHRRNVPQDLLCATERWAVENGHLWVSEKELAASAGTSEAMIHYYFKNRDNLLFCAIDKAAVELGGRLLELELTLENLSGSPTRYLIEQLIAIYTGGPAFTKLILLEFLRPQSAIREKFLERYEHRSSVILKRLLDGLVRRGIYRDDINTQHVAFTILSLVIRPVAFGPLLSSFELHENRTPWIDHVVRMIDGELSANGGNGSRRSTIAIANGA
jgi:AcrR family transcriptional regulator